MRKAALLALPLAVSGCSSLGKYFHDTLFWPGSNPNAPTGDSENMRRARGETTAETPILPQSGNIWPGAPQPLPTLKDVENPNSQFNHALGDPATYFGGASLDHAFDGIGGSRSTSDTGAQLQSGQSITAGETNGVRNGVQREKPQTITPLPTSLPDSASRYLQKTDGKTIVIPNGDGTSTLIAPDGAVRTVKGIPIPK